MSKKDNKIKSKKIEKGEKITFLFFTFNKKKNLNTP